MEAPVVVLAFANDLDDRARFLRKLPEERRQLCDLLERAEKQEGLCELVVRPNCTISDLVSVLQNAYYRGRISVLHFGGHAGTYELLLESGAGEGVPAHIEGLVDLLSGLPELRLVFLNGCTTRVQAEKLLAAGVPTVIATSELILDEVATDLAALFYRALASGASIRKAYSQAVAAVKTQRGGQIRNYFRERAASHDHWPWELHIREGSEIVEGWSLPEAAGNPLFGLPNVPEQDLPESPYRYLEWFRKEDAEIFFGRSREIRDAYELITAPTTEPVVLFYGQSGVGKSSLLEAGLLPRLRANHAVSYGRRESSEHLTETLRGLLGTRASPLEAWTSLETANNKALTLIVDQVEEVFTRPSRPNEFDEFVSEVARVFSQRDSRPRGKLVLGFRKEWLAEIEASLRDQRVPRTKFFLERLGRAGIIDVVNGPTVGRRLCHHYKLHIDEGLAQIIADDLLEDRDSPVAPTLQILLSKMWAETVKTEDRPCFTLELYQEMRRHGLLLDDFVREQLDELSGLQPKLASSGLILDLLAYHTTQVGTSKDRSWAELTSEYRDQLSLLPPLIDNCKDLYLLVSQTSTDRAGHVISTTRLTHDTLAPLIVRRFRESDKPGQRARRILENRGEDWRDDKTGAPLDEVDLARVEQGAAGMRTWTSAERRLVAESRRMQKRRLSKRRLARATATLFVIAIVATSIFSWQLRLIAESRELASRAVRTIEQDPVSALQLAIQASRKKKTVEAEDALRRSLAAQHLSAVFDHGGRVLHVSASPDGRYILTAGSDSTGKVWEVNTGQLLHVLNHRGWVLHSGFSSDSRFVVTASRDRTARLWSLGGSVPDRSFLHDEHVLWTDLSANGRYLVTASGSRVWLWDVTISEAMATMAHASTVRQVRLNSDGSYAVSASMDGTAGLWSIPEAKQTKSLVHYGPVLVAQFSKSEPHVATASSDTTLRIWDVQSGKEEKRLVHPGGVLTVEYAPTGSRLLSVGPAGIAYVWDAALGESPMRLLHEGVRLGRFAPDGSTVATAGRDGTIRVWETTRGSELVRFEQSNVKFLSYMPDARHVVTAGDDGSARIWRAWPSEVEHILHHDGPVLWASFSEDGTSIATASADGSAGVWDVESGDQVATLRHGGTVNRIVLSADREMAGTASDDSTARVWQLPFGREILRLHHLGAVEDVSFNSRGDLISTASADCTAAVWELGTGDRIAQLRHHDRVRVAAFHPDDDVVVTAGADGSAAIWDLQTGSTTFLRVGTFVQDAAFSPEGDRVVTVHDDQLTMWTAGGDSVWSNTHDGRIDRVAFSRDGKLVATASRDGTARLWNVKTGRVEQRLQDPDGSSGSVYSAQFSPDSRFVVTADQGGHARVWKRALPPRLVAEFAHPDYVFHCSFSPDGRRIVTAGRDGTARVHVVDHGALLSLATSRLPRAFASTGP